MQALRQEMHLWPARLAAPGPASPGASPGSVAPLRLPFQPVWLRAGSEGPVLQPAPTGDPSLAGAMLEPFLTSLQQLRLFVCFPPGSIPQVNGQPVLRYGALAPGDELCWDSLFRYRLALYCRPRRGSPPASVLGKPCPVCRVPFAAQSACLACACGLLLHCEEDPSGLQCAQLSRLCPVCQRPLILTEGYAPPFIDED